MVVVASPNEIVRLCPKFPCPAPPEYVIEFRPFMPMTVETSAITVFAS
jgi:hypothetical protein